MSKSILKHVRYLTAFLGYSGYGFGTVVLIVVLVPLAMLLAPFPAFQKAFLSRSLHCFLAFLTRAYLPGLGIYSLKEISGVDVSASPVVYVANHRGRLDGPLLLGLINNTGVIIKSKYTRRPLYAVLEWLLDFISINPNSTDSLARALARCQKLFQNRRSLLVFPEGTRSASGRLRPFRDLAFRVAIEHNIAVVPVIIYNDFPFMTKTRGSYFPMRKFNYYVRQLAPICPEPEEKPRELMERVRSQMAIALKNIEKKNEYL